MDEGQKQNTAIALCCYGKLPLKKLCRLKVWLSIGTAMFMICAVLELKFYSEVDFKFHESVRKSDSLLKRKTRLQLSDIHAATQTILPTVPVSLPMHNGKHIILLYTELFGKREWSIFGNLETYKDEHGNSCPALNCELSYDKNLLEKASVVLFHAYEGDIDSQRDLRMLSRGRRPNQMWVYFTHEVPSLSSPHAFFYNGLFNWTMTYQDDSDIRIPYSWELGTWQRRSSEDTQQGMDHTIGKDRLVYVEMDSCGFFRDNIIVELQKYVTIDVYGKCSKQFHKEEKVCKPGSKECLQLKKRYKFVLAFELHFCKDFISDRYYDNIVNGDAVPVVLGGGDYEKLAVPSSYIDALKFDTIEKLGEYLKLLDKNNDEYNQFHTWRKFFTLGPPKSWTCEICKKINNNKLYYKTYNNLGKWYGEENCRFEKVKGLISGLNFTFNFDDADDS